MRLARHLLSCHQKGISAVKKQKKQKLPENLRSEKECYITIPAEGELTRVRVHVSKLYTWTIVYFVDICIHFGEGYKSHGTDNH